MSIWQKIALWAGSLLILILVVAPPRYQEFQEGPRQPIERSTLWHAPYHWGENAYLPIDYPRLGIEVCLVVLLTAVAVITVPHKS